MEEPRFWQLIDRAREARGGYSASLRELLIELPDADLFAFQHELERQLALSDRAELAGAACLVLGSCSEERFAAFRAWLISRGPNALLAALADPEALASLEWESSPELPELLGSAREAWRARTGRDDFLTVLPDVELDEVPFGQDPGFPGDRQTHTALLRRRYPRLAAKLDEIAAGPVSERLAPRALTDLGAADPETRAQARVELRRVTHHLRAEHIGGLVERACDPSSPERAFLVRFISDVCVQTPGHWALGGFDIEAPRLVGYFDHSPLLRERYEALEAALPALLTLLADQEVAVRSNAAMSVSWFARSAARVRPALARALAVERDARVVSSLLLALALQDRYLHDEGSLPLIAANLGEPSPIGDAASIALYGYGDEPAREAFAGIERLLAGSCDPDVGVPWRDGDLATLGVLALRERLPARASDVERVLFSLLERGPSGASATHSAQAHALPVLLWLVSPRQAEPGLAPRLARLLGLLAATPSLATPAVSQALSSLGLPDDPEGLMALLGSMVPADELAVDIALNMTTGVACGETGTAAALELVTAAAAARPERTLDRATALAAELAVRLPPADATQPDPVAAQAALLVATAVLAAEKCGAEPDPAFDALAEATLCTPHVVPFFARFLRLLGEPRQRRLLDDLASRRFAPRWGRDSGTGVDDLLVKVLPVLGPATREHLLEACLDHNWRVVLKVSAEFPSRRVVGALLPRLADSLLDLAKWAPLAVGEAVERDAAALAQVGREAELALREAPQSTAEPVRRLYHRALEKLSHGG